ncbi:DNA ligase [Cooperia oncophora]
MAVAERFTFTGNQLLFFVLLLSYLQIYDLPAEELLDSYKIGGDVSKTIRDAIEKNNLSRTNKGNWSIQKVDRWLTKLTEFTKDDEQINHLKFAAKRLSPIEVQYLLRLVMKDLRFNAGVKHILDGLHASAYEAFQSCRDLAEIVERYKKRQLGNVAASMEVGIRLGTPVLPMLVSFFFVFFLPFCQLGGAKCQDRIQQAIEKHWCKRDVRCNQDTMRERCCRFIKLVLHSRFTHEASNPYSTIRSRISRKSFQKRSPLDLDLIIDAEVLLVDKSNR